MRKSTGRDGWQIQQCVRGLTDKPLLYVVKHLVNEYRDFRDLPGYPGTTAVLGDALIDMDTNNQPVWVWRAFDHLDVNRHPYTFPDWTHSNCLVYEPDGSLLLSMRH